MPEVREDPTTGIRTVISGDRGHRPIRLVTPALDGVTPADCPFCAGNEAVTLPTLAQVDGPDGAWRVRAFPNRFPALRVEATEAVEVDGLLTAADGLGAHEVIAETPEHGARLWEQPAQQRLALRVARDRLADLRRDRRLVHLAWFRNHGALAGASQPHPHAQIVGAAHVPWMISQMVARATAHHAATGQPLLASLLAQELRAGVRVVAENDHVVALAAWAPRFTGEVWLVPRRPDPRFDAQPDAVADATADLLSTCLQALHEVLAPPAHNVVLYQAPADAERGFVWHLRICPRRVALGGWELMTGGTILPLPPEEVANALRTNGRGR